MQKSFPLLTLIAVILLFHPTFSKAETSKTALSAPVTIIKMEGPASLTKAELSGLAWHNDQLILLPQYPERFAENVMGSLFSIPKARILAYLDGTNTDPVRPLRIAMDMEAVKNDVMQIAGGFGYQGFEAITFRGDTVYLSTESENRGKLYSFLVCGRIAEDGKSIALNRESLVSVPLPVQIHNKTYETMFIADDRLIAIFEANGVKDNPSPKAQVYGLGDSNKPFEYLGEIPIPHMEYRVTDITSWSIGRPLVAINYYFPGDIKYLSPQPDPGGPVEHLVALSFDGKEFKILDVPPLELKNENVDKPRNWEGIVRLDDRGFLLVTDKFPETILGFAPNLWEKD